MLAVCKSRRAVDHALSQSNTDAHTLSQPTAIVRISERVPYIVSTAFAEMDASLVTPGEVVGSTEQYEAGDGVYMLDGNILACIVGARTFDKLAGHAASSGQPSGKVRHSPPLSPIE